MYATVKFIFLVLVFQCVQGHRTLLDKSLSKEISGIIQKFEDIKQEADLKIETLASLQRKIADTPSFLKKIKHFFFSDEGRMRSSSDEKSNDEGLILGVMNAMVNDGPSKSSAYHGKKDVMNDATVSDSPSKSSAYHGKRSVIDAMVSDGPSKSSAYHGKRGVKQESLMELLTKLLDANSQSVKQGA